MLRTLVYVEESKLWKHTVVIVSKKTLFRCESSENLLSMLPDCLLGRLLWHNHIRAIVRALIHGNSHDVSTCADKGVLRNSAGPLPVCCCVCWEHRLLQVPEWYDQRQKRGLTAGNAINERTESQTEGGYREQGKELEERRR